MTHVLIYRRPFVFSTPVGRGQREGSTPFKLKLASRNREQDFGFDREAMRKVMAFNFFLAIVVIRVLDAELSKAKLIKNKVCVF